MTDDIEAALSLGGSRAGSPRLTVDQDSTYITNMKAIQVMLDERLLERLDATQEVKNDGRSAVLRRAVEEYLRRRARASVASQYRKAYGKGRGLGKEFAGWEEQGAWPEE